MRHIRQCNGYTYKVNDDYTATLVSYSGSESSLNISLTTYIDESGNYDNFEVSAIGDNAFSGNTFLQRVSISSQVKQIESNAFNCPSLQEVIMQYVYTPCRIGDGAFPSEGSYKIYVPSENVDTYKSEWSSCADHISANPQGQTVTIGDYEYVYDYYDINDALVQLKKYNGTSPSVTIPRNFNYDDRSFNVHSIASEAFAGNTSIETVTFPSEMSSHFGSPSKMF